MDVKLIMFRTDGKRKEFPIVNRSVTIGRAEGCDLRVPLLSVSRRHCQIAVEDGKAVIRDLGSSNGTYVNNKRVTEQPLQGGDRLVIGPIVFTIQINGQPEEVQSPKSRAAKPAEPSSGLSTITAPATSGDDTGAPIPAEQAVDPISDLEELVAEALSEEGEDEEEDSAASRY